MAPEIHARTPYQGASVDLFACAIILFITFTQHPPFSRAEPQDPFYKLLCANRADLFWKAHSRNKPEGFFSEQFKDLITSMLSFDPTHRLTLAEVKSHPWYNGPVSNLPAIQAEFAQRKARLDADALKKQQEKEIMKKKTNPIIYGGKPKVYRGEGDAEEEKMDLGIKRELEIYIPEISRTT